jgi:hypothetical protein
VAACVSGCGVSTECRAAQAAFTNRLLDDEHLMFETYKNLQELN